MSLSHDCHTLRSVQLIEVTSYGVRSAAISLKRRDTPLRFVLFPMLHLGAPAFYEEVTQRLKSCQLIVAEGVVGRSITVTALAAVYTIPSHRGKGGLVKQNIDYGAIGVPVINPDATAAELHVSWNKVPALTGLAATVLAPVVGIWIALVGFPAAFAKALAVDDLPSREQLSASEGALGRMEDALVRDRDARLLTCLDEIHEARAHERIDVAVVYGATHMPAVVHHLSARYGDFARDAEWMDVFAL